MAKSEFYATIPRLVSRLITDILHFKKKKKEGGELGSLGVWVWVCVCGGGGGRIRKRREAVEVVERRTFIADCMTFTFIHSFI